MVKLTKLKCSYCGKMAIPILRFNKSFGFYYECSECGEPKKDDKNGVQKST